VRPLFTPWRMQYIRSALSKSEECFICRAVERPTEENLVIFETDYCIVVMNRYPYTRGHLMVCPKRHVASLTELSKEEFIDLFKSLRRAVEAVRRSLSPIDVNIGINIGRVAGAGLEDHVHVHVVPRWNGVGISELERLDELLLKDLRAIRNVL